MAVGLAANCLPQQGAAGLAGFPGYMPSLHLVMRRDVNIPKLCPSPEHASDSSSPAGTLMPSPISAFSLPEREPMQTKWFPVCHGQRGANEREERGREDFTEKVCTSAKSAGTRGKRIGVELGRPRGREFSQGL